MYNTECSQACSFTATKQRHMLKEEQQSTAMLLFSALHKTPPGSIFWLCTAAAKNRCPEGVRQPRAGRKMGRRKQRGQKISVISIPSNLKRKKESQLFLFTLSCLFSLEGVIFSFPVFLLYKHAFFLFGTEGKESTQEEMKEKRISTTLKSS